SPTARFPLIRDWSSLCFVEPFDLLWFWLVEVVAGVVSKRTGGLLISVELFTVLDKLFELSVEIAFLDETILGEMAEAAERMVARVKKACAVGVCAILPSICSILFCFGRLSA
ncbi:MAG: hypothetical protein ACE1S7_03580, partial [Candidatus Tisiphia sp.]